MFSLHQVPFKNIKAHPVRTIILSALTMVQTICAVCGLMMALFTRQELSLARSRLGADILIYPTQAMSKISKDGLLMQGTPVQVYKNRSLLSRLDNNDNIAALSWQIYISDGPLRITGYEPETDFVLSPWFREGLKFIPPEGSVIAGSKVPVSGEDSLTIFQKEWPVSGHLLETGSELDEMVFVSMGTLGMLIRAAEETGVSSYSNIDPETVFSAALVQVDEIRNVESVTNWINIYIRKASAVRSEETLTKTASDIQSQTAIILWIAAVLWIVLLLALWIVQSILMKQRRKELYVWSVIGASFQKTKQVILQEALITHGCGIFLGILLSAGLSFLLIRNYFPGYFLSISDLFFSGSAACLLTLTVGCLSAWAAMKKAVGSLEGQLLLNT